MFVIHHFGTQDDHRNFQKGSMSGIKSESQISSFSSSLFLISHGSHSVLKEVHVELKHLSCMERFNKLVLRSCQGRLYRQTDQISAPTLSPFIIPFNLY